MAARSNGTIEEAAQISPPTAVSIVEMVTGTLLAQGNSNPPYSSSMPVDHILANWGVNEMDEIALGTVVEADWIADYQAVGDYLNSIWPNALIWVHYPWFSPNEEDEAVTLHGWIDTLIATRSYFRAGPDEAVWFKPNIATLSEFGTGYHYSPAGDTECARQWAIALGYISP